jgi:hypothetical protein
MPSILVRIKCSASKHDYALVLTIVDMGLFDHTLDGILDIICFGFLNLSWLGYVTRGDKHRERTYSCSASDIFS